MTGYYRNLIALKHKNKALWNGDAGGPMIRIKTNKDKSVFAFYREKEANRVIVLLNLTKKSVALKPELNKIEGLYTEYSTGLKVSFPLTDSIRLESWGYKVYIK